MSIEFKKSGIITATSFTDGQSQATLTDITNKYKVLEYLESTGTQWIDTGWLIPATPWATDVVYYYKQKDTTDRSVAGIRQLSCKMLNHYNNYYESFVSIPTSYYSINTETRLNYWVTSSTKNVFLSSSVGNYFGSTSYTPTAASGVNTLPLFGFRETDATSATWLFYGYIKYYKIFENDILVHHFIPAQRKSDSVLGMYDLCTNTFKVNAGSGTFVAGPELTSYSSILTSSITEN